METKQYKNLGNSIRDSVFRIKEAPTMLPDETIEKLGLGEDDILSIENENDDEYEESLLLEGAPSFKDVIQKLRESTKELKKARALVQKLEAQQEKH